MASTTRELPASALVAKLDELSPARPLPLCGRSTLRRSLQARGPNAPGLDEKLASGRFTSRFKPQLEPWQAAAQQSRVSSSSLEIASSGRRQEADTDLDAPALAVEQAWKLEPDYEPIDILTLKQSDLDDDDEHEVEDNENENGDVELDEAFSALEAELEGLEADQKARFVENWQKLLENSKKKKSESMKPKLTQQVKVLLFYHYSEQSCERLKQILEIFERRVDKAQGYKYLSSKLNREFILGSIEPILDQLGSDDRIEKLQNELGPLLAYDKQHKNEVSELDDMLEKAEANSEVIRKDRKAVDNAVKNALAGVGKGTAKLAESVNTSKEAVGGVLEEFLDGQERHSTLFKAFEAFEAEMYELGRRQKGMLSYIHDFHQKKMDAEMKQQADLENMRSDLAALHRGLGSINSACDTDIRRSKHLWDNVLKVVTWKFSPQLEVIANVYMLRLKRQLDFKLRIHRMKKESLEREIEELKVKLEQRQKHLEALSMKASVGHAWKCMVQARILMLEFRLRSTREVTPVDGKALAESDIRALFKNGSKRVPDGVMGLLAKELHAQRRWLARRAQRIKIDPATLSTLRCSAMATPLTLFGASLPVLHTREMKLKVLHSMQNAQAGSKQKKELQKSIWKQGVIADMARRWESFAAARREGVAIDERVHNAVHGLLLRGHDGLIPGGEDEPRAERDMTPEEVLATQEALAGLKATEQSMEELKSSWASLQQGLQALPPVRRPHEMEVGFHERIRDLKEGLELATASARWFYKPSRSNAFLFGDFLWKEQPWLPEFADQLAERCGMLRGAVQLMSDVRKLAAQDDSWSRAAEATSCFLKSLEPVVNEDSLENAEYMTLRIQVGLRKIMEFHKEAAPIYEDYRNPQRDVQVVKEVKGPELQAVVKGLTTLKLALADEEMKYALDQLTAAELMGILHLTAERIHKESTPEEFKAALLQLHVLEDMTKSALLSEKDPESAPALAEPDFQLPSALSSAEEVHGSSTTAAPAETVEQREVDNAVSAVFDLDLTPPSHDQGGSVVESLDDSAEVLRQTWEQSLLNHLPPGSDTDQPSKQSTTSKLLKGDVAEQPSDENGADSSIEGRGAEQPSEQSTTNDVVEDYVTDQPEGQSRANDSPEGNSTEQLSEQIGTKSSVQDHPGQLSEQSILKGSGSTLADTLPEALMLGLTHGQQLSADPLKKDEQDEEMAEHPQIQKTESEDIQEELDASENQSSMKEDAMERKLQQLKGPPKHETQQAQQAEDPAFKVQESQQLVDPPETKSEVQHKQQVKEAADKRSELHDQMPVQQELLAQKSAEEETAKQTELEEEKEAQRQKEAAAQEQKLLDEKVAKEKAFDESVVKQRALEEAVETHREAEEHAQQVMQEVEEHMERLQQLEETMQHSLAVDDDAETEAPEKPDIEGLKEMLLEQKQLEYKVQELEKTYLESAGEALKHQRHALTIVADLIEFEQQEAFTRFEPESDSDQEGDAVLDSELDKGKHEQIPQEPATEQPSQPMQQLHPAISLQPTYQEHLQMPGITSSSQQLHKQEAQKKTQTADSRPAQMSQLQTHQQEHSQMPEMASNSHEPHKQEAQTVEGGEAQMSQLQLYRQEHSQMPGITSSSQQLHEQEDVTADGEPVQMPQLQPYQQEHSQMPSMRSNSQQPHMQEAQTADGRASQMSQLQPYQQEHSQTSGITSSSPQLHVQEAQTTEGRVAQMHQGPFQKPGMTSSSQQSYMQEAQTVDGQLAQTRQEEHSQVPGIARNSQQPHMQEAQTVDGQLAQTRQEEHSQVPGIARNSQQPHMQEAQTVDGQLAQTRQEEHSQVPGIARNSQQLHREEAQTADGQSAQMPQLQPYRQEHSQMPGIADAQAAQPSASTLQVHPQVSGPTSGLQKIPLPPGQDAHGEDAALSSQPALGQTLGLTDNSQGPASQRRQSLQKRPAESLHQPLQQQRQQQRQADVASSTQPVLPAQSSRAVEDPSTKQVQPPQHDVPSAQVMTEEEQIRSHAPPRLMQQTGQEQLPGLDDSEEAAMFHRDQMKMQLALQKKQNRRPKDLFKEQMRREHLEELENRRSKILQLQQQLEEQIHEQQSLQEEQRQKDEYGDVHALRTELSEASSVLAVAGGVSKKDLLMKKAAQMQENSKRFGRLRQLRDGAQRAMGEAAAQVGVEKNQFEEAVAEKALQAEAARDKYEEVRKAFVRMGSSTKRWTSHYLKLLDDASATADRDDEPKEAAKFSAQDTSLASTTSDQAAAKVPEAASRAEDQAAIKAASQESTKTEGKDADRVADPFADAIRPPVLVNDGLQKPGSGATATIYYPTRPSVVGDSLNTERVRENITTQPRKPSFTGEASKVQQALDGDGVTTHHYGTRQRQASTFVAKASLHGVMPMHHSRPEAIGEDGHLDEDESTEEAGTIQLEIGGRPRPAPKRRRQNIVAPGRLKIEEVRRASTQEMSQFTMIGAGTGDPDLHPGAAASDKEEDAARGHGPSKPSADEETSAMSTSLADSIQITSMQTARHRSHDGEESPKQLMAAPDWVDAWIKASEKNTRVSSDSGDEEDEDAMLISLMQGAPDEREGTLPPPRKERERRPSDSAALHLPPEFHLAGQRLSSNSGGKLGEDIAADDEIEEGKKDKTDVHLRRRKNKKLVKKAVQLHRNMRRSFFLSHHMDAGAALSNPEMAPFQEESSQAPAPQTGFLAGGPLQNLPAPQTGFLAGGLLQNLQHMAVFTEEEHSDSGYLGVQHGHNLSTARLSECTKEEEEEHSQDEDAPSRENQKGMNKSAHAKRRGDLVTSKLKEIKVKREFAKDLRGFAVEDESTSSLPPRPAPPVVDLPLHQPADVHAALCAESGMHPAATAAYLQAMRLGRPVSSTLGLSAETSSVSLSKDSSRVLPLSKNSSAVLSSRASALSTAELAERQFQEMRREESRAKYKSKESLSKLSATGASQDGMSRESSALHLSSADFNSLRSEIAMVANGTVLGSPGGWNQSLGIEVGQVQPVNVGKIIQTFPRAGGGGRATTANASLTPRSTGALVLAPLSRPSTMQQSSVSSARSKTSGSKRRRKPLYDERQADDMFSLPVLSSVL
eukprot:TRINITY_DN6305_c0_g1_i1.p1 TRINITY_DN6305_c0_g1~~TRINITY_DN6305_c0_g1_i1.p1  ORF type:complete len:3066 (+),score=781.42 TRINITY_DN6305_c0_g1_i1:72-9269(+)